MNTKDEALEQALDDPRRHRLIAAAELRRLHEVNQELLEALKVLVENGGIGAEQMFHNARAAIAKATGESA